MLFLLACTTPENTDKPVDTAEYSAIDVGDSATDADSDGSTADVDCNDDDATVHPGATETPYDGVDQDCDSSDLTDVDGDGYANGATDCDDGNPDVHVN